MRIRQKKFTKHDYTSIGSSIVGAGIVRSSIVRAGHVGDRDKRECHRRLARRGD
jgi:hypothetical protein